MPWSSKKRRVVVPYELGSSPSAAALEALAAARSFVEAPADVVAVHVVEPIAAFVTSSEAKNRNARENLDQTLAAVRASLDAAGHPGISAHVRLGDAADEIAAYVKEHEVELVVMPSSRRDGVRRLVLGSVAEAVLRRVECPILLLHAD